MIARGTKPESARNEEQNALWAQSSRSHSLPLTVPRTSRNKKSNRLVVH